MRRCQVLATLPIVRLFDPACAVALQTGPHCTALPAAATMVDPRKACLPVWMLWGVAAMLGLRAAALDNGKTHSQRPPSPAAAANTPWMRLLLLLILMLLLLAVAAAVIVAGALSVDVAVFVAVAIVAIAVTIIKARLLFYHSANPCRHAAQVLLSRPPWAGPGTSKAVCRWLATDACTCEQNRKTTSFV